MFTSDIGVWRGAAICVHSSPKPKGFGWEEDAGRKAGRDGEGGRPAVVAGGFSAARSGD